MKVFGGGLGCMQPGACNCMLVSSTRSHPYEVSHGMQHAAPPHIRFSVSPEACQFLDVLHPSAAMIARENCRCLPSPGLQSTPCLCARLNRPPSACSSIFIAFIIIFTVPLKVPLEVPPCCSWRRSRPSPTPTSCTAPTRPAPSCCCWMGRHQRTQRHDARTASGRSARTAG